MQPFIFLLIASMVMLTLPSIPGAHAANKQIDRVDDVLVTQMLRGAEKKIKSSRDALKSARMRLLDATEDDANAVQESLVALHTAVDGFGSLANIDALNWDKLLNINNFMKSHYDEISNIASSAAQAATNQLESLHDKQNIVKLSIQTMGSAVQSSLKLTKDKLLTYQTKKDKQLLIDGLDKLEETLEKAFEGCTTAAANFIDLISVSNELVATFATISSTFEVAAKSGSAELNAEEAKLRTEAYVSCIGVCVATLGFGCPACYAIAVGVVEGKLVPDLQAEWRRYSSEMSDNANKFAGMSKDAEQFTTDAQKNTNELSNFSPRIKSFLSFLQATGFIGEYFIDEYLDLIKKTQEACDKLLQTTSK